jgi:hypothetical protein
MREVSEWAGEEEGRRSNEGYAGHDEERNGGENRLGRTAEGWCVIER